MVENKNWKPYVYGKKSTYPKYQDRDILVWTGVRYFVGRFDGKNFVEDGAVLVFSTPVVWQYVDKVPNKVDILPIQKCTCKDIKFKCDYKNNGICTRTDGFIECAYLKIKEKIITVD